MDDEGVERDAAGTRAALARVATRLHLELVRWPDGEPVRHAAVELLWAGGSEHARTDGSGLCRAFLQRPVTDLGVAVAGFEKSELSLQPTAPDRRLELRPLSGLCGRVVDAAGDPLAGAEVVAQIDETEAFLAPRGRGTGPLTVDKRVRRQLLAKSTTSKDGWYFLPVGTRVGGAPLSVSARGLVGVSKVLEVERPRSFEPLEDLVIEGTERLAVWVVDQDGRPLQGALVTCDRAAQWGAGASATTVADGSCALVVPFIPTHVHARSADGRWIPVSLRIDGESQPLGTPIPSAEREVQIVVREMPTAAFRVLDRETQVPVSGAAGRMMLLDAAGRNRGASDLVTGEDGIWYAWTIPFTQGREEESEITKVRISMRAWQMPPSEATEFALEELSAHQPTPIYIDRPPGSHLLRGRALRGGRPVARLSLGIVGLLGADTDSPRVSSGARCTTDEQGRFATPWLPRDPSELVAVRSQWTSTHEFGVCGPMRAAVAESTELTLEIEPGLRVPVVLRGGQPGGRYMAFVSVLAAAGAIPATDGGTPLEVHAEGEIDAWVHVPALVPSRVSVGYEPGGSAWYATQGALRPELGEAVVFDPSRPVLPLTFELPPVYARVAGRVEGLGPDELEGAYVVAAALRQDVDLAEPERQRIDPHSGLSTFAPVEADGSFALRLVPRGPHTFFLVLGGTSEPVAGTRVEVEKDLHGLRLVAQPAGGR